MRSKLMTVDSGAAGSSIGNEESRNPFMNQILIIQKDNANDIKKRRKKHLDESIQQMMNEQHELALIHN